MAGKAKSTANKTTDNSGKANQYGAEFLTNGFEQAFGNYGDVSEFGKENYQALVACSNAAKSGLEELQGETMAYSKQAMEESAAVTESAIKANSIQELVEIQSNFAKSAFESYLGQMTKVADMFSETSRVALEPLNNRMADVFNKTQA